MFKVPEQTSRIVACSLRMPHGRSSGGSKQERVSVVFSKLLIPGDMEDLQQAAVVIGFLGEHHPGSIADACEALPTSARSRVKRAVVLLERLLEPHPAALDEVHDALTD